MSTLWSIHYLAFVAPSGPPEGISAVALGPRMIQINWSHPLLEEQNGIIQSYLVNITVAETGQHIQLTTNNNTITAENLHPFYHYHISVAAVTIAAGPYTELLSLLTPQDGEMVFLYHFSTCTDVLRSQIFTCYCNSVAMYVIGSLNMMNALLL